MMKITILLFVATLNTSLYAQECSDDSVVASLICTSPQLPDVRFYMNEFQDCKDGKITNLERSSLGMNVVSNHLSGIHTISEENITVEYAAQRILIDADKRSDYLSFLMPTKIIMMDNQTPIEINVTSETEPDYEGSDQVHFIGSFKMKKIQGKMICFVYR